MDKLLTVEMVAEIMSCEYKKAYYIFRSRERNNPFPSFKIGRVWYVKEKQFEIWIDAHIKKAR